MFNFNPEQIANLSTDTMESHSKNLGLEVIKSLAKAVDSISLFSTIIPLMFLLCRILIRKSSRAIIKRYANNEIPYCLMPLHTLNSWVENPLIRMRLDILFKYKTETHEMEDLPKLNEFKALNRKDQLY